MATKIDQKIIRLSRKSIKLLKKRIPVEAAYIFGSQVTGKTDEWSDIDIAAFCPGIDDMRIEKKINLKVKVEMELGRTPVELHLYDSSRLKKARPTNIYGLILETGIQIC